MILKVSGTAQTSGEPGPKDLGKVIKNLMGPKALGRRRRVNRDVLAAWTEVAGEELLAHTRVKSLRRGLLTIVVDSPPLCHHLASFRREDLLIALKEKVKRVEIIDLRFRAGSLE